MPLVLETFTGSVTESFIVVHKNRMTGIDQIPATPTFDIEPNEKARIKMSGQEIQGSSAYYYSVRDRLTTLLAKATSGYRIITTIVL